MTVVNEITNNEMELLLARVSHELLTPITSLILTTDDILDHHNSIRSGGPALFSDEELYSFATRISRSSADLRSQVSNILNHFNKEKSKPTLANTTHIIEELLEELKPIIDSNEVKVVSVLNKTTSIVSIEGSIKTIFRNILSNAVKFTAANTNCDNKLIEISIIEKERSVDVIVKDTGIGMSSTFCKSNQIFELGKRDSSALSKEVRGYGLGLSTTKQLIDSLEGTIQFDSVEGVGTTVLVSIPKKTLI
jgi:signal transduction histidine kinase